MNKTHEHLMQIYNRLLDHFGPRHWWPARTQFEVIVGAILTQNVSWKNVEKAIQNLDRLGLLDPHRLLAAPLEVMRAVLPSRYYRQKPNGSGVLRVLVREYQENWPTILP